MIKLLRANFARLFKDTAFLIVAGGTLGITIARIIDCAITNKKYAALGETDSGLTMKSVLFELMPAIGIFKFYNLPCRFTDSFCNHCQRKPVPWHSADWSMGRQGKRPYPVTFDFCIFHSIYGSNRRYDLHGLFKTFCFCRDFHTDCVGIIDISKHNV